MKYDYTGWELELFDNALNFRKYQFSLIDKYIKGKTAEVGPGTGENLSYYHHKTNLIHLYEPSEGLYQTLINKTKKFINVKYFNKYFAEDNEKFDTIIYLDVLEHIEKDEEEVIKAYSKLNKNGYLIISVPAFNFLYSKFDKDIGHQKRYIKKDFKIFSKLISQIPQRLIYYDSIGFLLIVLSKLFSISSEKSMPKKIELWDKFIPISKIIDKMTFSSFGKSLLCVFKK